jgi:hypothetical protein
VRLLPENLMRAPKGAGPQPYRPAR